MIARKLHRSTTSISIFCFTNLSFHHIVIENAIWKPISRFVISFISSVFFELANERYHSVTCHKVLCCMIVHWILLGNFTVRCHFLFEIRTTINKRQSQTNKMHICIINKVEKLIITFCTFSKDLYRRCFMIIWI